MCIPISRRVCMRIVLGVYTYAATEWSLFAIKTLVSCLTSSHRNRFVDGFAYILNYLLPFDIPLIHNDQMELLNGAFIHFSLVHTERKPARSFSWLYVHNNSHRFSLSYSLSHLFLRRCRKLEQSWVPRKTSIYFSGFSFFSLCLHVHCVH